ncbi:E3 ubiquitin-protein ligase RSL1-like [Bidens hawaiensis]|uniref:E3 ubiquitin-protein ligase RSL1-like n=1 Tax=Bidens hawaiensis TaxID=980011 RepID=UPI00404947EF
MANSSDQKPEQEETFTCGICIEPVTLRNKFNLNEYNNKCVHRFCTECMIKYIQMKLEDNQPRIKCPNTTCTHHLKPFSCRPKITQQLFVKWCDVLCESTVLPIERVYCPNKECSELILNECGDQNLKRCVCLTCKKPFCYMCKVARHEGFTCEETRKNKDENNVSFDVLYKKNKWRMCPTCGHCVERIAGCELIVQDGQQVHEFIQVEKNDVANDISRKTQSHKNSN